MSKVRFTEPGTYRWTVPDKVTSVGLEVAGGTSGDGVPGETIRHTLKVTPGATYEVTVGAGGYTLARVIPATASTGAGGAGGRRAAHGWVTLTYDEDRTEP